VAADPGVRPTDGDENGAGGSAHEVKPTAAWEPAASDHGVPSEPTVPPAPSYGPPSYGSAGYGPGYGHPGYPPPGYLPPGYGQPAYGHPGYGPGFGQPGMRAATADRERTIDVLKAAYGEGRLTSDEFESRAARTMAAKTYGELSAIVADLPAGPGGPAGGYYPPPVPVAPTNGVAVGSLVFSLVGLFMPLLLIPGLIMGHMARDQIRINQQRGDGFAVAGLVFGYLGVALWVLIIAVVAAHQ
jgi:hypothetical protein